jgi:hypothetical protein
MTPSQCPQAESALYWLLWVNWSWDCTGILVTPVAVLMLLGSIFRANLRLRSFFTILDLSFFEHNTDSNIDFGNHHIAIESK